MANMGDKVSLKNYMVKYPNDPYYNNDGLYTEDDLIGVYLGMYNGYYEIAFSSESKFFQGIFLATANEFEEVS